MSLTEIISELPKLSREQREAIAGKIAEIDGDLWLDATITPAERQEIEQRLAEIKRGETKWGPWSEAKARIADKLRAS